MSNLHSNDNVYTPEGDPSMPIAYDGGMNALRWKQRGGHFSDDIVKCIFIDQNLHNFD